MIFSEKPVPTFRDHALTKPPETAHAEHDHRAARPEFLHVGCVAFAHRIWARLVAGINAGHPPLAFRIDPQARHPSPDPARRGAAGGDTPRPVGRPHAAR